MKAEISIVPLGRGWRLGEDIAQMLQIIDQSGLNYRVGPMGTTIAGDFDQIMDVVKKCHAKMRQNSKRVITFIKIDDDADYPYDIDHSIESLEKRLGRSLPR